MEQWVNTEVNLINTEEENCNKNTQLSPHSLIQCYVQTLTPNTIQISIESQQGKEKKYIATDWRKINSSCNIIFLITVCVCMFVCYGLFSYARPW